MTDPTNAHIDDTIDQIDDDALTAHCASIATDGDESSGSPACPDEPDDAPQCEIAWDLTATTQRATVRAAIAP